MTIKTIVKKIVACINFGVYGSFCRERIYQLQIAYNELCDSGLKDYKTELKKLSIYNEIDKLQTMLMEIGDVW